MNLRHRQRVMIEPLPQRVLFALTVTIDGEIYVYATGDQTGFSAYLSGASPTEMLNYGVEATLSRDRVLGNADDFYIGPGNLDDRDGGRRTISATVTPDWPAGAHYLIVVADDHYYGTRYVPPPSISAEPIVYVTHDPLPDGPVYGTTGNDRISVFQNAKNLIVMNNGVLRYADATTRPTLIVDGGAGNDRIFAHWVSTTRMYITGSEGHDRITGGRASDELSGSYGIDHVWGGNGDDFILGGASNDTLVGDSGNDTLIGSGGHDYLVGSFGANHLIGGPGNDRLYGHDNVWDDGVDTVSGGIGTDSGTWDLDSQWGYPDDEVSSVELRIT